MSQLANSIPIRKLEKELRKVSGEGFVDVLVDSVKIERLCLIGYSYWFEYHCNESHKSPDAPVWYHSHQKAIVLGFDDCDPVFFTTLNERGEEANCLVYRVRFDDGLEWTVFEDELMLSKEDFYRPPPPTRTTSTRRPILG